MNALILDPSSIETAGETQAYSHPNVVVLGDGAATEPSALLVGENGRPDPQWVRGRCPECGDDLISNMYFSLGDGYIIRWECWNSRGDDPQCSYRRVL